MSNHLIMARLGIIAACAALAACDRIDAAPAPADHWAMAADPQGGVWRMNTETGAMEHCTTGGDGEVHCIAASSPPSGAPAARQAGG